MIRDRAQRSLLLALLLTLAGGSVGCVERRYTIRTDPPGALIVVNGEEIGPSPASRSFTYYGDRRIQAMAEGYQILDIDQPIRSPWWDNYFTEFFTENLLPITLRDERVYTYRLVPVAEPPDDQLLSRAENLRIQAQAPPTPRRRGLLGFFGF
jgi:hypothetical protein